MSRIGVALLMLALAASGCGAGDSPATAGSGVEGVVVAEPACPVQAEPRSGPDDCTPRPVPAEVEVRAVRTSTVVATVPTSADGGFRVGLDPGEYELVARDPAGMMAGIPLLVEVRADQWTRATVMVDPGIR
jgi:hypothetical protein